MTIGDAYEQGILGYTKEQIEEISEWYSKWERKLMYETLTVPTSTEGASEKISRIEQMSRVQVEALELFRRKNTDYGDSFADYGVVGVLVRMSDKIKRYMSVSNNGISLVNDEALRDTLIDLHNYSAMAIMLMDEKSPNKLDEKDE